MIKKAILGILGLIIIGAIVLGILVSRQSDDFGVIRDATFNAPPERVFEQVNDFHKWEKWSPWAKLDPAMKTTYSGAPAGVGSSYSWVGNSDVGEGKMTITESKPAQEISVDLEFIKPFPAQNVTLFTFRGEGGKTTVTWKMSGKKNIIMKAFGIFVDMDKLIGADFEKGLAQLKPVVESAATDAPVPSTVAK